jgi:hypothetical protein
LQQLASAELLLATNQHTIRSGVLPAVIALVVIVAIVGFLMVRARGRVSYDKLVIEDQIKTSRLVCERQIDKLDRKQKA